MFAQVQALQHCSKGCQTPSYLEGHCCCQLLHHGAPATWYYHMGHTGKGLNYSSSEFLQDVCDLPGTEDKELLCGHICLPSSHSWALSQASWLMSQVVATCGLSASPTTLCLPRDTQIKTALSVSLGYIAFLVFEVSSFLMCGTTTMEWLVLLSESVSCSVMSDSLQLHGLKPARLLCSWDFPVKNTGVGCLSLLQGIFLTQDQMQVSRTAGRFFTVRVTREALCLLSL